MDANTLEKLFAQVSEELRAGKPVLVADNFDRENEVDAIAAAATITPEWMGWLIHHSSGYLCAPLENARADRLGLPIQWNHNQDPLKTCYTVSCDAARGVSTGISAHDRRETLRVLADDEAGEEDLVRPGHILPLRARDGGVLERPGHTEAAVDLMKIAKLSPVGVIGELVHPDGEMMRYYDAVKLAQEFDLLLVTIEQLITYLHLHPLPPRSPRSDQRVQLKATALLPTPYGSFHLRVYQDRATGDQHVALYKTPAEVGSDLLAGMEIGKQKSGSEDAQDTLLSTGEGAEKPFTAKRCELVRVHSECLTGEAFGSLRCECGPQLATALRQINARGGAVIYLRGHEGRGIGLAEKIRAYYLQERGRDTAQANEELGWPVDAREYGASAAILRDLGINSVKLLTNNPDKVEKLRAAGIEVLESVPLAVGVDPHNIEYLRTKKNLGHTFANLDNYDFV